jgi:hypothetical protein
MSCSFPEAISVRIELNRPTRGDSFRNLLYAAHVLWVTGMES